LRLARKLRDVVAIPRSSVSPSSRVDGRPTSTKVTSFSAGHDADADAHGLEGAAGRARVLGDEDEDRLVATERGDSVESDEALGRG